MRAAGVLVAAVVALSCFQTTLCASEICNAQVFGTHLRAAKDRYTAHTELHMTAMAPGSLCQICMATVASEHLSDSAVSRHFNKFFGDRGISFEDEDIAAGFGVPENDFRGGAIRYRFSHEELASDGDKRVTIAAYMSRKTALAIEELKVTQPNKVKFCQYVGWDHQICQEIAKGMCVEGACCNEDDFLRGEIYAKGTTHENRCADVLWERNSETSGNLTLFDDTVTCRSGNVPGTELKSAAGYACARRTAVDTKDDGVGEGVKQRLEKAFSNKIANALSRCTSITSLYAGMYILDVKKCNDAEIELKAELAPTLVMKVLDQITPAWKELSFFGFLRLLSENFSPEGEGQVIGRHCDLAGAVAEKGGVLTNNVNKGRIVNAEAASIMCNAILMVQTAVDKKVDVFTMEYFVQSFSASKEYAHLFVPVVPSSFSKKIIRVVESSKQEKEAVEKERDDYEIEASELDDWEVWRSIKEVRIEAFDQDPYWEAVYSDAFENPPAARSEMLTNPRSVRTGRIEIPSATALPLPEQRFRQYISYNARVDTAGCFQIVSRFTDEQAYRACRSCVPGSKFKFHKKKCMGMFSSTHSEVIESKGACDVYSAKYDNKICINRREGREGGVVARQMEGDEANCFKIIAEGSWPFFLESGPSDWGWIKMCTSSYLDAGDWVQAINHVDYLVDIFHARE